MKEFTITSKGFKVLPVTNNEILGWGGLGICDYCNTPVKDEGTFIAVLNSVYCQQCYNDWHKSAMCYPEDEVYEERFAERMLARIQYIEEAGKIDIENFKKLNSYLDSVKQKESERLLGIEDKDHLLKNG